MFGDHFKIDLLQVTEEKNNELKIEVIEAYLPRLMNDFLPVIVSLNLGERNLCF